MSLKRALGFESGEYHAAQPVSPDDDPIEVTAGELRESGRGILLEVIPNPENNGPESMAAVYEAMYAPESQPIQSFEIWYHQGETRFFILADSEREANNIREAVGSNYPDTVVKRVDDRDEALPTVSPEDSVGGAYVQKHHRTQNHEYLPIKYYDDGDGWNAEQMPIGEIISGMRVGKNSSVVVQATMTPLPESWTESTLWFFPRDMRDLSAHDVKETTDYEKEVDMMVEQAAFGVNFRILAISPDEAVARDTVADVAGKFKRKFRSSQSGMKLAATAIDARTAGRHRRKMKTFLHRMAQRERHIGHDTVLGHKEVPIHIPQKEAGAPGINWKHSSSGSQAPVDRPEHQELTEDDIDEDRLPPMKSTLEDLDGEA